MPLAKLAVQLAPQLMPPGVLLTVPVPERVTVSTELGTVVEPEAAEPPPHPLSIKAEVHKTRIKKIHNCDGRPELIKIPLLLKP